VVMAAAAVTAAMARNSGMKVKTMISNPALLRGKLWLIVGGALASTAFGQNAPRTAPVPRDPLELATGQIQTPGTPATREATLQLLARARNNLALRSGGQGYDLKVNFTVDSQGQTNYDGAWEMEDQFAPGQGNRWTATAASGYSITTISSAGKIYSEGTATAIPLRLHEARGLLLDPVQSRTFANRGSIRTSTATFHGTALTCVLLSSSRNAANPALGRGWNETEECIDPQSGLLQVHSEAPGRYAVYDYADAPQLGGHVLPRSVTVTEGGRIVSKITVESLQGINAIDPSLLAPTEGMKAAGPATAIASATKISRVQGPGPYTSAITFRPVCVFGMVTPTGQLVEAHSLQPADPNSQAAVEDAKQIDFSPSMPAGVPPRQHFVFVIENFVAPQ
jgi:hypothetical protein